MNVGNIKSDFNGLFFSEVRQTFFDGLIVEKLIFFISFGQNFISRKLLQVVVSAELVLVKYFINGFAAFAAKQLFLRLYQMIFAGISAMVAILYLRHFLFLRC